MLRIKLGETTADQAKIYQQMFNHERNKMPERSFWRLNAHILIRKLKGPSKRFCSIFLIIHHTGGSKCKSPTKEKQCRSQKLPSFMESLIPRSAQELKLDGK